MNAMEKKKLILKKDMVAWDQTQREQFKQSKKRLQDRLQDPVEREKIYNGPIYKDFCASLNEKKQKLKELELNINAGYAVYQAYYRSCPNRGVPFPMCPGIQWRNCPTCFHIFSELNAGTQQYILQEKEILKSQWHGYLCYDNPLPNVRDYYYDLDNPENDLANFTLDYHDLKGDEEDKLKQLGLKLGIISSEEELKIEEELDKSIKQSKLKLGY